MKKDTGKTDLIMANITQAVIKSIENGTAPWLRPWDTRHGDGAPANLSTGSEYAGLNALYLRIMGDALECPYWIGYGQAKKLGGTVRKGQKATQILAPMSHKRKDEKTGDDIFYISGFRAVSVFNVSQCDGLELPVKAETVPYTLQANRLDNFLKATGATVVVGGDRACFIPSLDQINMPEKNQFKNEAGYYGTLLHELTHWTGHKARLNRLDDKSKRGYAFEELVAELGAYYASEKLGCPNEAENHASYLQSWLKALKSDTKYLWQAASLAEKAARYMLDLAEKGTTSKAA